MQKKSNQIVVAAVVAIVVHNAVSISIVVASQDLCQHGSFKPHKNRVITPISITIIIIIILIVPIVVAIRAAKLC